MDERLRHTFSKNERLCGKTNIDNLLAKGKYGNVGCLRFRWVSTNENEHPRILISVPKKIFKRAVKRNLFKRRIRECWRKQKHLLGHCGIDILITYTTKECVEYKQIEEAVDQIIAKISKSIATVSPTEEIKNDN